MSTVSMMFLCFKVLPTQNSAVTFFWYSLSLSPCLFGLNSFTAYIVPPCLVDALISRTVPPAPLPSTRPHFPYFFDRCTCVADAREVIGTDELFSGDRRLEDLCAGVLSRLDVEPSGDDEQAG